MDNQLTIFKVRDLRKKDQFKIDDKYLNGYARVCKPIATAIYSSLCRHAEFHSQKAFPSQKLMAYQHDISIKSVRRAIKKLEEYNIITIGKERRNGKFMNYVYTLLDKSEWTTIGQKRPMVEPVDKSTTRQKTIEVKVPTKDNKVSKDNKYKNKDNKERTPAQEMREFLEGKEEFQELADFITNKTGIQRNVVIMELRKFGSYWTERNASGKKQRWELEKTFELKRRLTTWFNNYQKYNTQQTNRKIGIAL